jgi:uncharacterized membrane protein
MNKERGQATKLLWVVLCSAAATLLFCESLDAWQRSAPAVVWLFKLGPLLLVLPGVLKDRLRSMVWLSFITLLYFLFAVQRMFAEPSSVRAMAELTAIVMLFMSVMFYVRWRTQELRAGTSEEAL